MASCFFSLICKNKGTEDDELKFAECKVNINKLPSYDEDIHRRPSFAKIQKKDEIKSVPQNSKRNQTKTETTKSPMKEKQFNNVDAFQFDPFSDNAFGSNQRQLTTDGTPTYGHQNSQKSPQSSYFPNGQMTPTDIWNQNTNASSDFGLSTDYEDNEYNEIRQQARNIVKPRDQTGTSNKSNNFSNVKDLDENCSSTAKSDCYFSDSGDDPDSSSVDEKDKGNVSNNQFNSFTNNSKVAVQHAIVPNSSSISTSSFLIKQEEAPPTRFTFDDAVVESPPSQRKSTNAAFDRNLNSMSATKVKKSKSPTIGTNGRNKHETSDSVYQGTNSRKQDQVFEGNHKTSNAHGRNSFSHNDGFPESFADFDNDGFLFESKNKKEANTGSITKSTSDHGMQSKEQNIGNEINPASSSISSPPLTSALTRKQKKITSRDDDAKSDAKSYKSNGSVSAANAKAKLRKRRKERENEALQSKVRNNSKESDDDKEVNANDDWLFDGVTDALGPHDIAADLESLSSKRSCGNKSVKSHRSHRSHRSKKKGRSSRRKKSDDSVGSRGSRYSVRSTMSQMSQMSEQSRSVANDLLRLEMQLAMVGSEKSKHITGGKGKSENSVGGKSHTSRKSSSKRSVIAKRSKVDVRAPPGKLGLILANTTDGKGTVVSCVRETSILVHKISAGDRIIAIDEDDVSRLTVSELTTIMARKTEFERVLTVLKTPKSRESSV